jgi:hypothetical protein
LTDGWRYRLLDERGADDPTPLAAIGVDDAGWPVRRLNCWAVPEELASRRVLFRRTFRVPKAWRDGTIELWQQSWFFWTTAGRARYWLDGREVTSGEGRNGLVLTSGLAADSEHVLAVEVRGEGQVCGVRGNTWLAFTRSPARVFDLAGAWSASKDYVGTAESPLALPGTFSAKRLSRDVVVPSDLAERPVYLRLTAEGGVTGCLINGRYVRRHHHALGNTTFLNLTPWIVCGATNRIEVLAGGSGRVDSVGLWGY